MGNQLTKPVPRKELENRPTKPLPTKMEGIREEFENLLAAAKSLLSDRNFKDFRVAAVKAQKLDPENPQVGQIFAVGEILIAASKTHRISETVINWYKILGVPIYCNDVEDIIKAEFKRITRLIDPNDNRANQEDPLAFEALSLVHTALYVLEWDLTKSRYDRNLKLIIEQESRTGKRKRSTPQEAEAKAECQRLSEESDEMTKRTEEPEKEIRPCIMCGNAFEFTFGIDHFECENCTAWIQELLDASGSAGISNREFDPNEEYVAGEAYDAVGEDDHGAGEKIWAKCHYCTRGYEYNVSKGYDKDECLLRCKNEECKEEFFASGGKLPPLKKMKIDRTGINLSMVEAAEDGAADNDNGNGDGNAAGEDGGANNDDKQLKSEDLEPGKMSLWRLMKVNPDTGKYDQEVDEHDLKILNEIEKKNQENELKTEKNVSVQGGGFDLDPAEACYIIWLTCPSCEHQNEYNLRDVKDDNDGRMSCKDKGCRGDFDPSETMEFKRAQ